jgi:hypothetical protein
VDFRLIRGRSRHDFGMSMLGLWGVLSRFFGDLVKVYGILG